MRSLLALSLSIQDRIGGRIHTFRTGPYVADLGAMVITGLGGNPLSVLKRQIELKMSKIKRRCPLYFTTGKRDFIDTMEFLFGIEYMLLLCICVVLVPLMWLLQCFDLLQVRW